MSRSEDVEVVLGKAEALEKKYNWVRAVSHHYRALRIVGKKDFLKKGEIQERIGFCFYRAAMQAESREEFKERMRRAIEAYEKAHGSYEKLTDEQKAARLFRSRAVAKFLGYWLTSDPSEKRRLLDECLELEGKALAAFLESEDMFEYGRTYNELSLVFFCRAVLAWDRQTSKRVVETGREWGEKAVGALSNLGSLYETARAYFAFAICVLFLRSFIAEPEEIEKNRLEAVKYLNKAVDLSEKVGDAFLLGLSHLWLGATTGGKESIRHFEKVLECGERTRDNFLIAWGLDMLAMMNYWEAIGTEDPDQRRKLAQGAMEFYDKAEHHYFIVSFMSSRGGTIGPPAGHAEHYLHLATWETNLKKRRKFLEKSEKAGMEALKLVKDSEMPDVVRSVLHVASKTLQARARLEPDLAEKRSLLEKALKYRKKTIEILGQRLPFAYYSQGVMQNYLADIKAELAHIEPDLDNKRRLLEEAVLSKEKCLKLCNKMMPYYERMGDITSFAPLQGYQDTYATLLTCLYDLTNRPEHLRKAIEISQKAIESARKLDMISLIAESYWKIAKGQDILGEHLEAAGNFEHASKSYMKAVKQIPQLKDLYHDYASYMQAWNEIEKAKHHHARRQYGQAKEHYEKAADLHKSTERWNHLTPNYLAWAQLEEAEDLSRREQTEEAKKLFQQAANLFADSKKSIEAKLEKIEAKDEKQMAAGLFKASDIRREYCLGRIALEEAKILDRQGDLVASSKKYELATETFREIAEVESEQTRKELQPIVYLCQAWQKMMMAEARASSTLYGEAAELFKQAKEHTLDQPTSLLAMANSSFCKALQAGTEFEITRDTMLHLAATRHLESAANYYVRGGFKTASEYSKATQRLFDAYVYIDNAKKETDPEKTARYYMMVEKILQASAGSYTKAKHPKKSEVRRLLESVKEERQLAVSLTEVLHDPTITSATTSFSTPTSTHEQAVGLERFEHAHIQANLFTQLTEVKVGENVASEIELDNVGKEPATLVKVDDIVPAGFNVIEKPEMYRVEDSYLNMKGKMLAPLKTEEIRLVLRPATKGTFTLKPRIMYLDETGKYRSHEPEPVTITVKELGITGWIKGEK